MRDAMAVSQLGSPCALRSKPTDQTNPMTSSNEQPPVPDSPASAPSSIAPQETTYEVSLPGSVVPITRHDN
jgi:hypothetical protein